MAIASFTVLKEFSVGVQFVICFKCQLVCNKNKFRLLSLFSETISKNASRFEFIVLKYPNIQDENENSTKTFQEKWQNSQQKTIPKS